MMASITGAFAYLGGGDMSELIHDKVLIVEGTSDKRKIEKIVREPIDIICTNGTISQNRLDELMDHLLDQEIYILADADDAGEKLRKRLKREFPEAKHLYIHKMYREVAAAPIQHLVEVLLRANLEIHKEYLNRG
jgi:toprim domain protein